MPTLRELQQRMRDDVLAREDGGIAAHVVADGIAPAERLAVYRRNVTSALVGALRLSYPAVERLVGNEFFEGCARQFVTAAPPQTAWLYAYGGGFAEFLSHFPPAGSLVYLADVARLEWAVNKALHAPDGEVLALARIAEVPEREHHRLCFSPDPALSLLRVDHPADAIWRAVLAEDDTGIASIEVADGPHWLLVERQGGVDVQRLDEPAWRFSAALCAGRSLGAALALVPEIDAAAILAEHLTKARFAAFHLEDAVPARQDVPS